MDLEKRHGILDPREVVKERIGRELKGFGVSAPEDILEYLIALEHNSHFNDDARAIVEGIKNVLKFIDSFNLKPIEKKRLLLAAYLGDIGKAYTPEIVKLFSVENINNTQQTVLDTLEDKNYFPGGANEINDMELELAKVGVVVHKTSMRDFWDKHAFWTREILDRHQDIFDSDTRKIAASHHLDRGIDPYKIKVDSVWQVSNEVKFSIFLLMAMDKYQAFVVRSGKSHAEAIKLLKDIMRPFDGDDLKDIIIRAIEQLGATSSVFPEGYVSSRHKTNFNIIN